MLVKPVCASVLFVPSSACLASKPVHSPSNPPQVAIAYRFDGLRILLAGDNRLNQQVALEAAARAVSADVSIAGNGAIALEWWPRPTTT